MICPHCFHCGAEHDEYYFDRELYCGICAQRMPVDDAGWSGIFQALTPEQIGFIEQSLNRIGGSKSGLDAQTRQRLAEAVDAFSDLRLHGAAALARMSEPEWLVWLRYACTYFAPNLI